MVRIQNLVYAGRQLARARSAFCNRVHFFGPRIRIHSETPSRMRPDAACLWKSERIAIRNEDCISQHVRGHGTTIHDSAS